MPTRTSDDSSRAPRAARAAALATAVLLYALVVGLEVGTPARMPPILVAIPLVVALAFGPPMIIGSAVVVVATRWAFLLLDGGRIDTAAGTTATVLAVAAVACFVVHRRGRETARLREVTSVAETAQRAVLRPPPATVGPFRAAASYRAAAQFARIGGDLYAVAETDHGVRALIGDVRGKGLDAVATASAVLGSFHEAAYACPILDGLAHRLETSLRRHLDDAEAFVTAFLVEIHPDGRTHALSCGHPAPLILSGDTVLELPVPPGLPLGLRNAPPDPDAPRTSAATADTRLQPGDTLLMYTDGLTEARDVAGDFYPLPRRLTHYLRAHPGHIDPGSLLDWLQQDAYDYADGCTHDDAALLALTWTPATQHTAEPTHPATH
ncbi:MULTISPECIES: PP2C family protein-serine/threonine phosphatase [Streptomyces]|uniref:Serine/threonine-protein phosphatase n=1 Tax=Streptomyces dengpaensis TaxID=2049881 RepID=A0ABM6SU13_9ACTN|nr:MULTISPECIES: PP2C family protein-serine/threonine phosphatase [Streptomyces]AVH57832.1 serine/threonine-protein phosphatase [Streptomyces dengpaensis]PIB04870.1 serine/threonine protein phosphatase [Streptomyces sp. HG99]